MHNVPLISCVMPTRNRRRFVRQALAYFRRQDYLERELIIVDDGEEDLADLVGLEENIHYLRLPQRAPLGLKRNLACQQARGRLMHTGTMTTGWQPTV